MWNNTPRFLADFKTDDEPILKVMWWIVKLLEMAKLLDGGIQVAM